MADLPRIARERLRVQPAGDHPDADLLTAFAEQALPEGERTHLLEHLAACADCREVVALASPEALPTMTVLQPAPRRLFGFLPQNAFALAAVVVAGLVVVSIVAIPNLQRSRSAQAPRTDAYVAEPASPPAAAEAVPSRDQSAAAAKQQPAPAPEEKDKATAGSREEQPTSVGGLAGGKFSGLDRLAKDDRKLADESKRVLEEPQKKGANVAPAPAPAAAIAAPKQEALGATAVATQESETRQAPASEVANPAEGTAAAGQARAKAEPQSKAAMDQGVYAARGRAARFELPTNVRWSLSADGKLRRSRDGGGWENVAVAPGAVFRAVAVVGPEVWAGGTAGALYHSSDGGQSWTRQLLQADGRPSAADIVRLEFSDARHGSAGDADGRTWTTSDGGQTWELQR